MYSNNVSKKAVKPKGRRAVAAHAGWRPDVEIFFLVGILLAMLLFVSPAMAQDGTAKIRMAHLSPDAPAVMVELDGEPVEALQDVSYRDATGYLDIPAGPHDVAVFAAADPSEPVLEVSIAPEAGQSYTVAGVGLLADETFGARLFEDDTTEPDEGQARVRVIHAVPDVGPATVSVAGGSDLFALPGFANASDYADVDAGTYTLEVTPAGAPEPAFDVPDVTVEEGEIYTAFAVGQASEGTLDTMITVDSDNGRVVGPQTLEDTSGDLSLLEETPQPESAPESNGRLADQPQTTETSSPISTKEIKSENNKNKKDKPQNETSKDTAQSEPSQSEPSQSEPAPSEAPVLSEATAPAPAPVVSASVPVSAAPAPVAPLYSPPPVSAEPVVEEIIVPTAAELAPEPLVVDTTFVPQPVHTTPVAAPQIPIPTVEIPPVPTVEIPSVPQVPAGSWSSQISTSTQTVTGSVNATTNVATANVATNTAVNGVATTGFVPPAPSVPPVESVQSAAATTAAQNVVGGTVPAPAVPAPVDSVVGFVSNTPAIVNSGARRKFVTIRSKGRKLPNNS